MTTEPKGPFSEFTINKAFGGKATLAGKLSVVVDGEIVTGTFRAFGPKPAQNGGREHFDIAWTPDNAVLAARQTQLQRGELPVEDVPNVNTGFELRTVGWGKLFEFTAEEKANPKFAEQGIEPSFRGAIRVLTHKGPRDIDLFATHKQGVSNGKAYNFESGSANLHDPVAAAARRAEKARAAAPVDEEQPNRRTRRPKADAADATNG